MDKGMTINKGNYSLDTAEREEAFARGRAFGVENDYYRNRREWEEFPRALHTADYPLLVDLELSTVCNLRCPFCYTLTQEFREKVSATLMDFGLFRKVVDEIAGKVFAVRLSLRGEPTLHPDFLRAVRYAKEKGIGEVSMLTNGSRLTPEFFSDVLEAGLDWITISFDGVGSEYEKNRSPLKFEEMYQRLADMVRIKREHGTVKPVIKIQAVWPAIEKDPGGFLHTMTAVSDLVAFNPLIDFSGADADGEVPYEEGFVCPQPYQRLVIGADGTALLCANDEEGDHPVGDATVQTVHEIWHGARLREVREAHRQKDGFKELAVCRKCYLPRRTRDDRVEFDGRTLVVKNYL